MMDHDVTKTETPADTRTVLVIEGGGWWLENIHAEPGDLAARDQFERELVAAREFMVQVAYPNVDTGPMLDVRTDGRWYCSVDDEGNFEIGSAAA